MEIKPLLLSLVFGICISLFVFAIYNRIPDKWLQEWDANPDTPDFRKAKRLDHLPHFIVLSCISIAAIYIILNTQPDGSLNNIENIVFLLLIYPGLALLFISDLQNRIIPHQFLAYLLIIVICKSIFFSFEYQPDQIFFFNGIHFVKEIGMKLLESTLLSLFFFIPAFLFLRIKKTEAIGFGDIKLIFTCSMLCGIYGTFWIIAASFLFAGITGAVSYLYRYTKTVKKKSLPRTQQAKTHFAEDPAYLPLAPFLTVFSFLYLSLHEMISSLSSNILWNLLSFSTKI